jgi:hypothetical protein
VDTDHDGMPDAWEAAHGLNLNNPDDRNGDYNSDGYTNLEDYLNEIIVNGPVEVNDPAPATEYLLLQNYPNPFNPMTTISYHIPKTGFVSLIVYDALGRKAQTLVNEVKTQGKYSIDFNASNLSSGVYFYTFRSGDFISTKKFIVMK